MTTPVLEARRLSKRYGRVVALDHTDFDLMPNEILAVIGDNGAGKSTLIKALCGAVIPDGGEVLLEGKPVHFRSPIEARLAGIETVYQNLALSPALSIADNMFLGREIRANDITGKLFRRLDRAKMAKIARDKLAELGLLTIQNINQSVETLSGGQRQGVAVARAAAFGSRVVIMDEPTAALGVKQAAHVLRIVNEAKRRGLAVIFITHQVMHAMAVGDHFAVLIRGAIAADFRKGEKTREEIADLMAGGESMADLEASIEGYMATHEGHPPRAAG